MPSRRVTASQCGAAASLPTATGEATCSSSPVTACSAFQEIPPLFTRTSRTGTAGGTSLFARSRATSALDAAR